MHGALALLCKSKCCTSEIHTGDQAGDGQLPCFERLFIPAEIFILCCLALFLFLYCYRYRCHQSENSSRARKVTAIYDSKEYHPSSSSNLFTLLGQQSMSKGKAIAESEQEYLINIHHLSSFIRSPQTPPFSSPFPQSSPQAPRTSRDWSQLSETEALPAMDGMDSFSSAGGPPDLYAASYGGRDMGTGKETETETETDSRDHITTTVIHDLELELSCKYFLVIFYLGGDVLFFVDKGGG